MSDSKVPIPMIVIVLLAVALYVTAAAVGWGPHGGFAGCAPSEARKKDLSSRGWLSPARVERSDMHLVGCVRTDDELRFQTVCTIGIAAIKSWAGSRSLKIVPESKLQLAFQPKGDDSVDLDAKNPHLGESVDLMIPKEGATVVLGCTAPANVGCTARLE